MKISPDDVKKIGIFRALQLGDMLCAIPAIRALRTAFPEAEICLIGLGWARSFTDRFHHYFNRFIEFPGYPGLPEQEFSAPRFASFLNTMQEERFDLVIQMQGNGTLVNPMVELFGARKTAGYTLPHIYAPATGLFMEYPDYGHEAERHVKLMEFLGLASKGTELEFPLTPADYQDLEEAQLGLKEKAYICIHPGSRGAYRQWPVEYFAKLADLAAEKGFTPVITGTPDELPIVNKVVAAMQHQPVVAAGKTSLGAVAVLLKNAFALISNCTGVSHIASALETPSVIISMDGEPHRWGPQNKQYHTTINWLRTPDFQLVEQALLQLTGAGCTEAGSPQAIPS